MPTGAEVLAKAETKRGYAYDTRNPFRLTGERGYFDCSGLVFWTLGQFGIHAPTVSWTQALWCHDAGLDGLSVAEALSIPGALMFKGPDMGFKGYGSDGHVAFSAGDGVNVMEAKGHDWGVLLDRASAGTHPWTNGARIPGVDYGTGAVGAPPIHEGGRVNLDEIVDVYSDGHGNTWGLLPTGAVYTLTGSDFWGAYGDLVDSAGHGLPAKVDFVAITARWDQRPGLPPKPGYTLWCSHYRKGEHYDFGPDHPGRLTRAHAELAAAIAVFGPGAALNTPQP